MGKIKVALLSGGRSSEREVSLASAHEVVANLDADRYDVTSFDPEQNLSELVNRHREFDLAFPVLHGPFGEDGTIQGMLELLNLPYVGSGVMSSAMCMNKAVTKITYRAYGLPVAEDIIAQNSEDPNSVALKAEKALGLPAVVKPLNQGSSVGLTVAKTCGEIAAALKLAWRFGTRAMIEKYISGRELTCAIIGNSDSFALPPIEIRPGAGHIFFDYAAKYEPGQALELCPAPITKDQTQKIQDLSLAAHKALFCRGVSRTDFILEKSGDFYLLETNTIPGLTSNSLLPRAAAAYGLCFSELLDKLIDLALESQGQ
ncbi:MAG: D-alanine--D-alanine ligase [Deltaproteobacteria bacterium]|jgi:D-alanine-D-alanine ligase|nr:D-alanine--D-alanine ligase [Deltaproteobacteria bacterium]